MKQGKSQEALSTYDEAGEYAPDWRQFKDAREAAAKHKSEFGWREADIRDRQQRVTKRPSAGWFQSTVADRPGPVAGSSGYTAQERTRRSDESPSNSLVLNDK